MFSHFFKKALKKDVSLKMLGKKIVVLEHGNLSNLSYSLQGTYSYKQVEYINELTGYSAKYGFVVGKGPVAIIGITNPDYDLKSFDEIWEYGKSVESEQMDIQIYNVEDAKKISNYTVYGDNGIKEIADDVKFNKISSVYDERYIIKNSDKYRVFNMDCKLKGKYSYKLALDLVKHEDFRMNGQSILFAKVDNRSIGIIGMYKDNIKEVAGFRDIWEYGKKEPIIEKITFLDDEQAKKELHYELYIYNYMLPRKNEIGYSVATIDRTLDSRFNFYDTKDGKDFRLTPMQELYKESDFNLNEDYSGYYVEKELNRYIIDSILPKYQKFDKGHDISHITEVIFRSFKILSNIDIDEKIDCNMVYAAAAYHDLGMKIKRENHAQYSGMIVREDKKLKEFFDDNQIETIAQAVEDHSTSLNKEPRSIYGKILCDADKDDDYFRALKRAYEFAIKNFTEYSFEQIEEDCFIQLNKKFGDNGLVQYYILNEENSNFIRVMKKLANDEILFDKVFKEAIK